MTEFQCLDAEVPQVSAQMLKYAQDRSRNDAGRGNYPARYFVSLGVTKVTIRLSRPRHRW